ncbi:Uncharacterized conserved protein YlxW, UPF0749 family [Streptoalloteichus tenebrarius]|uniref:Uncharacterized conserved protein YlxW, UPF0749 family n=1 Tax=Streptoalloteichus tenebrarius (strain ATCC 17920 / DSM 40477 / JCM 4838 / CBS 697.72 / NBRC 16177 / NCIMB 11028 / NRRL B-12390 / A12253. 1 / ISP 5477) TaxID=1933 RepID=A0ABT1HQR1_STRSD|nr:Uncharacterized conserved protein YlxW, UPF0749 family [Streptoalloteichus tenebrarius]
MEAAAPEAAAVPETPVLRPTRSRPAESTAGESGDARKAEVRDTTAADDRAEVDHAGYGGEHPDEAASVEAAAPEAAAVPAVPESPVVSRPVLPPTRSTAAEGTAGESAAVQKAEVRDTTAADDRAEDDHAGYGGEHPDEAASVEAAAPEAAGVPAVPQTPVVSRPVLPPTRSRAAESTVGESGDARKAEVRDTVVEGAATVTKTAVEDTAPVWRETNPAWPEPPSPTGPPPARPMDFAASLLRGLFVQRLDPAYEEAARRRGNRPARGPAQWVWLVVGTVLVGVLFAVAALDAADRQPGSEEAQRSLADDVRTARGDTDELARRAGALAREVDRAREAALAGDADGRAALDRLGELERAAAAVPVTGPGLRITVEEAQGQGGSHRQSVLDRDLQVLVNSLWASGAEAVAVGGVRLQPRATVRQAGGAILVDNRPIRHPYVLEAIGPPEDLQTRFVNTDGYGRFMAFTQLYGTRFTVQRVDSLHLAAANPGQPRVATPGSGPAPSPSQEGPR